MNSGVSYRSVGLCIAILAASAGCSGRGEPAVRSHLDGRIAVSAEIDSTGDQSGFHVVVSNLRENHIDTLGYALTGADGTFSMQVVASERGVYPLTIRRTGRVVKQGQLVVADGYSATMNVELPSNRPITFRSRENGAWMAYRNTKAAHANMIRQLASAGTLDEESMRASVIQTTDVLWGIAGTYPGTMGAGLGRVESVVMLVGWNDSLAIERLHDLPDDSPGIGDAVRAGWRAEMRNSGLDSALALIDDYRLSFDDPAKSEALGAERVIALIEAGLDDSARAEAVQLSASATVSEWQAWAESAIYEMDNLQPGQSAPTFMSQARDGRQFDLAQVGAEYTMLEFYQPGSVEYQQDLPLRTRLPEIAGPDRLEIVSISLEPDEDLNEAFIDSRDLPGTHIVAPGGMEGELANLYNVRTIPKRFLLRNGVIIGKYHGRTLSVLAQDLQRELGNSTSGSQAD